MSGRIHAERLNSLRELGEEAERALLRIAFSDSTAKACAIMFLCELEYSSVMPIVDEVLSKGIDEDNIAREWGAQYEALRCLRRFPIADLVDEVTVFVRADNPSAGLAVDVLGRIDSEEARQLLREWLIAPPVEGRRYRAVRAVGAQRDPLAIPLLLELSLRADFTDAKGRELIEAMAEIDAIAATESALTVARRMKESNAQTESVARYLEYLREESTSSTGDDEDRAEMAIEQVREFLEYEVP